MGPSFFPEFEKKCLCRLDKGMHVYYIKNRTDLHFPMISAKPWHLTGYWSWKREKTMPRTRSWRKQTHQPQKMVSNGASATNTPGPYGNKKQTLPLACFACQCPRRWTLPFATLGIVPQGLVKGRTYMIFVQSHGTTGLVEMQWDVPVVPTGVGGFSVNSLTPAMNCRAIFSSPHGTPPTHKYAH